MPKKVDAMMRLEEPKLVNNYEDLLAWSITIAIYGDTVCMFLHHLLV
jgi:hypothetical protein